MTLKQKRRVILKSLGIGSAWITPAISSVVLPAHASTSTSPPANEEFLSADTDTFTVPNGVTQLKITVNGAGGGTRNYVKGVGSNAAVGGNGEQVVQMVTVVPEDTLSITVGGGGIDGWAHYQSKNPPPPEAGKGGTPGEGGTATNNGTDDMGGGGGGFSQVSGTGFSIQAGGGGGGSDETEAKAAAGGGTNGGAAGADSDGGNAGNGLGGKGSDSDPTGYDATTKVLTHSKGDDGSVIISSI